MKLAKDLFSLLTNSRAKLSSTLLAFVCVLSATSCPTKLSDKAIEAIKSFTVNGLKTTSVVDPETMAIFKGVSQRGNLFFLNFYENWDSLANNSHKIDLGLAEGTFVDRSDQLEATFMEVVENFKPTKSDPLFVGLIQICFALLDQKPLKPSCVL